MMVLQGALEGGSAAYAVVAPTARHCASAIAERRFSAFLTSFLDEEAATVALKGAGAVEVIPCSKKGKRYG